MHRFVAVLAVLFLVSGYPAVHADNDSGTKTPPSRNYNLTEDTGRSNIEPAKPYVLEVEKYNLTPDVFQKIALKAFNRYEWKIEANEISRLQGGYVKRGVTYKVEMRFTGKTIVTGYVPGWHTHDRMWLRSLTNYVKKELNVMSRGPRTEKP